MATTVPMLAPDGTSGDIPVDKIQDAVNAGFKKAIPMTSPDGKTGYIPEERAPDALKAGFKQTLQEGVKDTGTPGHPVYGPQGAAPEQTLGHFFGSAWDVAKNTAAGIKSAVMEGPQNPEEARIEAMGGRPELVAHRMLLKPAIEQGQKAVEAAKAGSPSLALGHGLAAALPMVGPAAANLGEQLGTQVGTGDYTGAAGTLAGNVALGEATRLAPKIIPGMKNAAGRVALLGKTPEAAYETALKPPPVSVSAADRAAMVKTGLENAIPVSPGGLEKLGSLVDDLNQKIKDTIAADPNRPISPGAVASKLYDVRSRFANQVTPASDLAAINQVGNEFTGRYQPGQSIPADQAQAMKQGTYQVLRGKYGEQGSAAVEAQKGLARGLKEEIATQFPEITKLNADESRLLDLGPVLERAVNRIGNHASPIGIGGPLLASGVKAATGSTGAAAALGIMRSVFSVPEIQSRLAIAVSKGGKIPFPQALERVRSYSASLAAASPNGTQDQSATSQPQQ